MIRGRAVIQSVGRLRCVEKIFFALTAFSPGSGRLTAVNAPDFYL